MFDLQLIQQMSFSGSIASKVHSKVNDGEIDKTNNWFDQEDQPTEKIELEDDVEGIDDGDRDYQDDQNLFQPNNNTKKMSG